MLTSTKPIIITIKNTSELEAALVKASEHHGLSRHLALREIGAALLGSSHEELVVSLLDTNSIGPVVCETALFMLYELFHLVDGIDNYLEKQANSIVEHLGKWLSLEYSESQKIAAIALASHMLSHLRCEIEYEVANILHEKLNFIKHLTPDSVLGKTAFSLAEDMIDHNYV